MQTDETQGQATETEAQPTEPQQEAPATEETEAPETEAKDGGEKSEESEESPDGEESKDEQPNPKPEGHKRAGGWQRKIEKQERELQMLRQQVAALAPQQPQQTQPAKEKTQAEQVTEYLNTLVEQRLAEREAVQRQQQTQAEFQKRTAEVRAANPDFDDVMEYAGSLPVSQAVQEALLTSENGPAIMYQLAKNPAELARLSALPPVVAAREIGRLEARLASSTAAPKAPVKPAARPPAPPSSVAGSKTSTRSLEDLPLSEYKRAYRSGRR